MSPLEELISSTELRIKDAQSRSDYHAVTEISMQFNDSVSNLDKCVDVLNKELTASYDKCGSLRENLVLCAAWDHADLSSVDILCALLARPDRSNSVEMIVDLLFKIPSPKSVPFLVAAFSRKYNYDIYDEIAVKCLDALAEINTADAWDAIKGALTSPSERIREHAQELLEFRPI